MKYKVGDKVRVRRDLEIGEFYGNHWYFNSDMEKYKGKEMTVYRVHSEMYDMEEDNQRWGWVDEMLEGTESNYKLIDVFNMISNGELKEGTKVIWLDDSYECIEGDLIEENSKTSLFDYIDFESLNDEVEVIESDDDVKRVEKLDADALTWNDLKSKQKIEILFNKINELIDAMKED
jgi:hypothetical protein